MSRHCRRMTSARGRCTTALRSLTSANSGLSMTRSRTYSPTPTSSRLTRNGTRQPQVRNSGPVVRDITWTIAVDSSRPSGTPSCGQLAMKPRRWREPHSIASSTDPPHSPPTATPCSKPQHREQQWRGNADRGVAGKHPDQGGADAHDQQGGDQGGLAADPVAVVTEDRGADRPGGEPDELGAESSDDTRVLALPGEEDLGEHQGGCGAVEEEVVPLDRGADRAGEDRTAALRSSQ